MPGFCYLLRASYSVLVNAPIPEPTFFLVLVIAVSLDDGAPRFHLSVPVLSRDLLVTFGPEGRNENCMASVNYSIKRFFSVTLKKWTKGDRYGRHLDHVSGYVRVIIASSGNIVWCAATKWGAKSKLCRKLNKKQHTSYLVRRTSNHMKLGQTHLVFLGCLFKLLLLLRPP